MSVVNLLVLLAVEMAGTIPLSGTVVDVGGQPVAGASVWLGDTNATNKGPEVLASGQADAQGRFRLDRADDLAGRGNMWSPTLWAYKPGTRVGYIEFKGSLPDANESVRVSLGPPASTSLRILQADGKPAKGAVVRPAQMTIKAPRPPDKLLDRLTATTDGDGRVSLDGILPTDILWLDVTAPGQLVQCLPIEPEGGTLSLRPVGKLTARIVADDPKAVKGWTIIARSRPSEPGYRGPYTVHWASEITGDDGRVAFPPLAVGQVMWDLEAPKGLDYLPAKLPVAAIREGETVTAEITMIPAVRVEGVVLEEESGAPVAGVTVDVHSLEHFTPRVNRNVTDAKGRISTLVLPGQTRFSYSFEMPKTHFLPPRTTHWVDIEVKPGIPVQTFTLPRLHKGALVRGTVIDEAGKPVPVASVTGAWTSAEFDRNTRSVHVTTDTHGEFVLGNLAPKSQVKVTASRRLGDESETATVDSAGEGGPVTVRVRMRPTASVSGRVLDSSGRPLAGASVQVKGRVVNEEMTVGSGFVFDGMEEIRTDRDGRFKTAARIPIGYGYRIEAHAPGYRPAESVWVDPPGIDIPDVKLRRMVGMRVVSGRVIDPAGKPVAGAEVFQSGDGPKKTRGNTDADGRFQVSDIPNAPAFLFVEKAGYHFVGRRVDASDQSVELTIRPLDTPAVSPMKRVAPAVSRDEERAIARALIEEARKAPGTAQDMPTKNSLGAILALVDPDRVIGMIENQVLMAELDVLTGLAIARFESDPGKVTEVLNSIGHPDEAALVALNLFDRLGTTASPALRRELLERAARRPPIDENSGYAASQLAKVADRWLDLGETDRGADLVRKAQALSRKSSKQIFPDPRDDLALALARVNLVPARVHANRDRQSDRGHGPGRGSSAPRFAPGQPPADGQSSGLLPNGREESTGGSRPRGPAS